MSGKLFLVVMSFCSWAITVSAPVPAECSSGNRCEGMMEGIIHGDWPR